MGEVLSTQGKEMSEIKSNLAALDSNGSHDGRGEEKSNR
jgi:hypothetical protein